jgi:hypothetical protein
MLTNERVTTPQKMCAGSTHSQSVRTQSTTKLQANYLPGCATNGGAADGTIGAIAWDFPGIAAVS